MRPIRSLERPKQTEPPLGAGMQELKKRAEEEGSPMRFLVNQRPVKASQILLEFGEELLAELDPDD